jgi:hypothetical protein
LPTQNGGPLAVRWQLTLKRQTYIERWSLTPARTALTATRVTHEVEVSWNQAWNGTDQQRLIEIKDNRLTIKSPTMVSPISGKQSINTLVWERMK